MHKQKTQLGFDSMTHTERPALRPTEGSFAAEVNESHTVVVKLAPECGARREHRKDPIRCSEFE